MNKIETERNWTTYNHLDGYRLADGERLSVEWPDGTEAKVTVKIQSSVHRGMEQGGGTYEAWTYTAGVWGDTNGVKVFIPLAGVKAKRLSKPQGEKHSR